MKPMTADALQRFAFKKGARLELDGKLFNASRLQVVTSSPAPATPLAAPAPVAPPAPAAQDREMQALMLANLQVMVGVKQALEQMNTVEPEDRPRKWVFTVKRDSRGLISTIEATAKE